MDESRMNFFSKCTNSIINFDAYKNFVRQSAGAAVLYLLTLSLILGAISLVRTVYDYNQGIASLITAFESNVPDFVLENGKLDVSGNMPIVIQDGGTPIIIDTTGNTSEQVLDSYPGGILVTRDRIVQKQAFRTRVTEFGSLAGIRITKAGIQSFIPYLKWFSLCIVFFGLIFFFAGKLLSALIVSVAGLILNRVGKTRLLYKDVFKLSVYALTLPIVFKVLLGLAALKIPFFWLFYYGLATLYLWLAIARIRQAQANTPPEQIVE